MLKGKRRKTISSSFGPDGRRLGGSVGVGTSFSKKRPLGRSVNRPLISSSMTTTNEQNENHCSNNITRPVATLGKRRGGGGGGGDVGVGTIQRAPVMCGLNVPIGSAGLLKKFQRPQVGRRAYKGKEDELLKRSSLGAKKSSGGMQRLLSRAGKGLTFVGKRRNREAGDTDESSDDDDDNNKEEDRPFEPLMVWESPFQGGEAKGIQPTL
jgi:hypothetical protein